MEAEKKRWLAWFFIASTLWLHLLFFFDYRNGMKRGYTDFAVFYTAGTILRGGLGHELYDRQEQFRVQEQFTGHLAFRQGPLPYIHPPFEALVFIPLSLLSYEHAFVSWAALTFLTLFGVAILLRRSVGILQAVPPWKFVIGAMAFYPVFTCFLQGQDSILQLLACAAAYNALKRNRDFTAGCWLGLGAFKFQFIVPMVVLFMIWGRRRIGGGFVVVAAALAILSAGIAGKEAILHYPRYALQVVETPNIGGVPLALMPNLHGLAEGWPKPMPGITGIALALAASLLVALFAARAGRVSHSLGSLELQFSLAVVVSVLIGWQTNSHDLSLLLLPIVLIADYCLHAKRRERIFALVVPALPLLLSPLWMVLWLVAGKVNLMAIPILLWTWAIGAELSSIRRGAPLLEQTAAENIAK
jgi:hypothetical protein